MAEGGEVAGRKEVYQKCSPCSENEHTTTAVKYCLQCKTAFCEDCLKNHNALFKKHSVNDLWNVDVRAAIILPTEVCQEHSKSVDLYCQHHDKIGCSTCMTLGHRCCERVLFIPKSTEELLQQSDTKLLNTQIAETIKKLESIRIKQQTNQSDLDMDKQRCMDEIDSQYIRIRALLDRSEGASRDEVVQTYEKMTTSLQQHEHEVRKCIVDLKEAGSQLDLCKDNEAQQFIEMWKCQGYLKTTEHVSRDANANLHFKVIDFNINKRIEELLTDLKSLVKGIKPYRVKKKYKVSVSVEQDQTKCRLYGVCVLKDGSVLLADNDNRRIKRLNDASMITEQYLLEKSPTDICPVTDDEVVITHGGNLQFMSHNPRLSPTRTLKVDQNCAFVGYSNGHLFITNERKSMFVYNMCGVLLRTVNSASFGQTLFSSSRKVAVSDDGETIFIADYDKGLVTVDRHGRVLGIRAYSGVIGTQGVCPDGSGGLFLCGFSSDNVVHLGREGTVLSVVATQSDGLKNPLSVSYDRKSSKLYVSQYDNNDLLVFDLE